MTNSISNIVFTPEKAKMQTDNTGSIQKVCSDNTVLFKSDNVNIEKRTDYSNFKEISFFNIPSEQPKNNSFWENIKKITKGAFSGIANAFKPLIETPILGMSAVVLMVAAATGSQVMLGITGAVLLGIILGSAASGIKNTFAQKEH